MASSKTLKDVPREWTMNKELSSDPSPVLDHQGEGMLIRKAASHALVSLGFQQEEELGTTQIFIDQKTVASIPAINEEWILDWQERQQSDSTLGKVKSKSRWREKNEISKSYLTEGLEENEVVEALASN
jgi:ribonuclease HI